jgi:hypothetical protein
VTGVQFAACGCELEDDETVCSDCRHCEMCCGCDDALYDADELGLDPEQDDARRYQQEVE